MDETLELKDRIVSDLFLYPERHSELIEQLNNPSCKHVVLLGYKLKNYLDENDDFEYFKNEEGLWYSKAINSPRQKHLHAARCQLRSVLSWNEIKYHCNELKHNRLIEKSMDVLRDRYSPKPGEMGFIHRALRKSIVQISKNAGILSSLEKSKERYQLQDLQIEPGILKFLVVARGALGEEGSRLIDLLKENNYKTIESQDHFEIIKILQKWDFFVHHFFTIFETHDQLNWGPAALIDERIDQQQAKAFNSGNA